MACLRSSRCPLLMIKKTCCSGIHRKYNSWSVSGDNKSMSLMVTGLWMTTNHSVEPRSSSWRRTTRESTEVLHDKFQSIVQSCIYCEMAHECFMEGQCHTVKNPILKYTRSNRLRVNSYRQWIRFVFSDTLMGCIHSERATLANAFLLTIPQWLHISTLIKGVEFSPRFRKVCK